MFSCMYFNQQTAYALSKNNMNANLNIYHFLSIVSSLVPFIQRIWYFLNRCRFVFKSKTFASCEKMFENVSFECRQIRFVCKNRRAFSVFHRCPWHYKWNQCINIFVSDCSGWWLVAYHPALKIPFDAECRMLQKKDRRSDITNLINKFPTGAMSLKFHQNFHNYFLISDADDVAICKYNNIRIRRYFGNRLLFEKFWNSICVCHAIKIGFTFLPHYTFVLFYLEFGRIIELSKRDRTYQTEELYPLFWYHEEV